MKKINKMKCLVNSFIFEAYNFVQQVIIVIYLSKCVKEGDSIIEFEISDFIWKYIVLLLTSYS